MGWHEAGGGWLVACVMPRCLHVSAAAEVLSSTPATSQLVEHRIPSSKFQLLRKGARYPIGLLPCTPGASAQCSTVTGNRLPPVHNQHFLYFSCVSAGVACGVAGWPLVTWARSTLPIGASSVLGVWLMRTCSVWPRPQVSWHAGKQAGRLARCC